MEQTKKERLQELQTIIEKYRKEKELEKKEHPERFTPQWPYELFGIECGEGWKELYQPIIDYINKYNEEHDDKFEIHQIKEKFGYLCFYVNKYNDELRQMIRDAEEKSYHTCEVCGKHIDKPINENYWIYAECEDCHNKWKENRQKAMEAYENKLKENTEDSENNSN